MVVNSHSVEETTEKNMPSESARKASPTPGVNWTRSNV